MIATSVFLISTTYTSDSIGAQRAVTTRREVPVIRYESIYSREFYQARELGFKPSLRLVISSYAYEDETILEYNGVIYTIIRTENVHSKVDELTLICEKRVKNG